MKNIFFTLIFFITSCHPACHSIEENSQALSALLSSIPKTSLKELLLFATLHSHTKEGHAAALEAWDILSPKGGAMPPLFEKNIPLLASLLEPAVLTSKASEEIPSDLYTCVASCTLSHTKKKGNTATSLDQLRHLAEEEIDLARALVLTEQEIKKTDTKISSLPTKTELALDMLALTILSRIGNEASPSEKIAAINKILFDDLEFRYPPLSQAAESAQEFSELSNVLFSRRGICLGSSVLYLCLAERLDLPLKIFTPPGHIFVGYSEGPTLRIIETTARGIEVPVDQYLGITLRSLPERTPKEVIGMIAFNEAATFLKEKKWKEALSLYDLAHTFEHDEELASMMSLCELASGSTKKSVALARTGIESLSAHRLEHDLLLLDLSEGALSPEAAEIIIETASPDKDLISQNITKLEKLLPTNPKSLIIPIHLASLWTMYGKSKEALSCIERMSSDKKTPCSVHYFLAQLYASRMDFPKAWSEVQKAARLAQQKGIIPKPLQTLILHLHMQSPHCQFLNENIFLAKTSV